MLALREHIATSSPCHITICLFLQRDISKLFVPSRIQTNYTWLCSDWRYKASTHHYACCSGCKHSALPLGYLMLCRQLEQSWAWLMLWWKPLLQGECKVRFSTLYAPTLNRPVTQLASMWSACNATPNPHAQFCALARQCRACNLSSQMRQYLVRGPIPNVDNPPPMLTMHSTLLYACSNALHPQAFPAIDQPAAVACTRKPTTLRFLWQDLAVSHLWFVTTDVISGCGHW